MPYQEEGSQNSLSEFIAKYCKEADKRISAQLGDVASIESLIDIRHDFEKRLRGYFKQDVKVVNRQVSESTCLTELEELEKQASKIDT